MNKPISQIGLALSGGGMRAAAYHCGVVRWLAENNLLEKVSHISSVSGGSLFTGLVFHNSGYVWPRSSDYLSKTLPAIRLQLTSYSLQKDAAARLLWNPFNWRFILSRANIIARSIEKLWGISSTLSCLPTKPVWSINGTTAENGRRFRLKNKEIGDYEIGYAAAHDFKLADAMAISAAFPCGIGPLAIDATKYEWFKRKEWDSSYAPKKCEPEFKWLHIYDGGLYDNLGLESLFDMGQQAIKKDDSIHVDYIIVSDAGAPYSRTSIPGPLRIGRLKRIADIGFDQSRALRVRALVNFLKKSGQGMYLQIGTSPKEKIKQYASVEKQKDFLSMEWLDKEKVSKAVTYPTTLCQLSALDFELLEMHGYETAKWNALTFPMQPSVL